MIGLALADMEEQSKESNRAESGPGSGDESSTADTMEVTNYRRVFDSHCMDKLTNLFYFQVDNSHKILLKIATLYAERLMNDICLVVDGIEYPAHRLILCASSDVFQVNKEFIG